METPELTANTISAIPLATLASLRQFEGQARSCCHTAVGSSPTLIALLMSNDAEMAATTDFESLVGRYYRPLYQFAFALARNEAEACDLTQQTFYVWATKGHQLRDAAKVKTWLFTTLHHEFLKTRRRQTRFPHYELEQVEDELPTISPATVNQLDAGSVVEALGQVEELYQAPLVLFYMEEHSYKEIAEILEVPIGTVQSRIARGKMQLQKILTDRVAARAKGQEVKHRG
jgi:RNA polymerase sigma factor (sigma-70 family)